MAGRGRESQGTARRPAAARRDWRKHHLFTVQPP